MQTNEIIEICSTNKSAIHVKPFLIGSATAVEQNIELDYWQGSTFRLYAEKDGSISTNQEHGHYWLLAEAAIPEQVISNVVKPDGSTEMIVEPLDLTNVQFTIFDLPREA